jgi:UDP-GlcNAc:undecaprenyl-phosphate GlcNAc-1-phosphate transferase
MTLLAPPHAGLLSFSVALVASLGLTVPVRALALRVGMVDLPGPRKVHLAPMPLLGGLAIYLSLLIAGLVSFNGAARSQMAGIFAGATLLVVVGTLDDRGWLHHQIKLFVAMPLAAVILLFSGVRAEFFETILAGRASYFADIGLTLFWVVGITASFSILDHMDGLCAGVSAVASLFFSLYAFRTGQILVGTLAAAVFGASLGFLRWNFNPAKIFMGDGGAMLLGFLMATLGLKLRLGDLHHRISWLIPVLILAVPIFDTTLISVSRSRRGLLPFTSPGKDHAAHRLSNLGLGPRGAVLMLYAVGCITGSLALVLGSLSIAFGSILAFAALIAALLSIVFLERAPYERQSASKESAH